MKFDIQIVNVENTQKEKYSMLEVFYKELSTGKANSRKIMSFAHKEAFEVLKQAQAGQQFTITAEKNDKGYWDWTNAGPVGAVGGGGGNEMKVEKVGKPTYETPEERAQRQVYIIRQSSLERAIQFFELHKAKPDVNEVLDKANAFTNYVMNGKPDHFAGLEEDIPQ